MRGLSGALVATLVVVSAAEWVASVDARQGTPWPPTREWLVYVDDLHTPFVETGRVRQALRAIAETLVRDGDVVTLRTVLTEGSTGPHVDRATFAHATKQVSGNGLKTIDILEDLKLPRRADAIENRAVRSLIVAHEALANIWHPGTTRRGMIFLSGGYADLEPLSNTLDAIAATAREQRATIFTIDTRSLGRTLQPDPQFETGAWTRYWSNTRESLRRLAEATGGFLRDEQVDLDETLEAIAAIMR